MARNIDLDDLEDFLQEENNKKQLELNKTKPKLNLEDFVIKKVRKNQYDVIDPVTKKTIGNFPFFKSRVRDLDLLGLNSIDLPDYITTDYPDVEPEYRGRGLGKQMYKFLEKETGKKIMPDTSLSESSSALHKTAGLGKEFGSSNYKPDIIEAIKKSIGPDKAELAEQVYEKLKNKIRSKGLTEFKSVAPILGKVGTAAVGGFATAAAEAAESEDMGGGSEQQALLRDIDEKNRRASALKSASDEERSVLGKMYQNIDNPSEEEKNIGRMKLLDAMLKKR